MACWEIARSYAFGFPQHLDCVQGDLVAAEAFGRRPGQVVPQRGDVDAVVDGLLNGVPRLRPLLARALFRLGAHDQIVAAVPADINHRRRRSRRVGRPGFLRIRILQNCLIRRHRGAQRRTRSGWIPEFALFL